MGDKGKSKSGSSKNKDNGKNKGKNKNTKKKWRGYLKVDALYFFTYINANQRKDAYSR